MLKFFN